MDKKFSHNSMSDMVDWTLYIKKNQYISMLIRKVDYFVRFFQKWKFSSWFEISFRLAIGRSTLVGQCPMKSLLSICPSFRPSVTKFSQDWIISFF